MKTSFKAAPAVETGINKFPCVGVLDDSYKTDLKKELVVLFTAKQRGTVLHVRKSNWKVGEHVVCWDMDQFRKLRPGEEIIIKG